MKASDLPVAALVREEKSNLEFYVAAQNHPGYGGTTLITRYVIGVRAFDAAEPDSPKTGNFNNERAYGNNCYAASNIHQWLNSDAKKGWYHPRHRYDAPPTKENVWYRENPYEEKPGFLYRFSDAFKRALLEVDIPYVIRTGAGEGRIEYVKGKAFLPSRTEINYDHELNTPEGTAFRLFVEDPYYTYAVASPDQSNFHGRGWNPPSEYATWDDPGIFDPADGWKYWLRSCGSRYSFLARTFNPTFRLSYDKVCCDVTGVRPVVNVDADLRLREAEEDGKIIYLV